MDPRHPRIALAANATALIIFFTGTINILGGAFFGHPGEKFRFIGTFYDESWAEQGWSLQEWIALVMIIALIGLSKWARREHSIPVVQSHGSSSEQYAALADLPTMVNLDKPEGFVNPNTAEVIASIIGRNEQQSSTAVSSAIDTLSSGEIGRLSAEAAAVNQVNPVSVHSEQTQNFEVATSNLSQEVKAVPLPKNASALPVMPDLDELISDKQDVNNQPTGLPELPDLSDI